MFKIKVTPVDGSPKYDLRAESRDVAMWERTTKGRVNTFGQLMETLSIDEVYKIAHIVARREQVFTGSLTEWYNTVNVMPDVEEEEVDEDGEQVEPDPTP